MSKFASGAWHVLRPFVADLLLVHGNPLIDIGNTRRVVAVIARGTLFDRSRLQGLATGASRIGRMS
jgi:hypothetical protein